MKIGYARVSTLDQNPDMQRDELEKAGCEEVIVDRISGTVASRPGLEKVRGDFQADALCLRPGGPA
jgi:DNA invertase Pin-like site-specific DNA recombinase